MSDKISSCCTALNVLVSKYKTISACQDMQRNWGDFHIINCSSFTLLKSGRLKPHLSRIILTIFNFLKNIHMLQFLKGIRGTQFLLMYGCVISQTLATHCSKMQVYDEESCKCKCKNEYEVETCEHPKEWDPKLCSCMCPESLLCSTGAHINPESCK